MPPLFRTTLLRFFIALALLVVLLAQCAVLPWLAEDVALTAPEVAHLRVPVLALCIAAGVCVQVALVGVWRLVDHVAGGRIFRTASFRWVDLVIGALAASGILGFVIVGVTLTAPVGHALVTAMTLLWGLASWGVAALLAVMRALLVQASVMHQELEEVI